MTHLTRLIYVDDSGSERFGLIVYGWVQCSPAGWRTALRSWLELRKRLYVNHKIPPSQELHATDYVNGRGRISTDPGITLWKDLGREVAEECLSAIRECPDVQVGAVYRRTTARGSAYHHERADLYNQLVHQWDAEHAAEGTFVFVSMDGDGSDPTYFNAHRSLKLDTRHVIEDPMFHDSRRSQWMQMADLVAYVAYQHLDRHPRNEYAWDWYRDFLAAADPRGGPAELKSSG